MEEGKGGGEGDLTVLVVSFSYVQILKSKNVKMLLSPSAVNELSHYLFLERGKDPANTPG